MAFVHVEDGGLDAEGPEQAKAADAEEDFLHDASGAIAAVDAEGEVAKVALVFLAIGVEQENRDTADVGAPGLKGYVLHPELDVADEGFTALVQDGFDGQIFRVEKSVVLGLPVAGVDSLLEIALTVKQAEPDKSDAGIAGGFGVVAGEDAQTAGGNGECFMEAELGREIGDGTLAEAWGMDIAPGWAFMKVSFERVKGLARFLGKGRFLETGAQFLRSDLV
jgi:hypothetical protein